MHNIKNVILLASLAVLPLSLSIGQINCSTTGNNNTDLSNPVNPGRLDDRTCSAEYREETIGTKVYGVYKVASGSLNSGPTHLQPRMERGWYASEAVSNVKGGNYARLRGTVRISQLSSGGTYIMQAKGTYSNPASGESSDPAICLIRAVPESSTRYKIVREEITQRDGVTKTSSNRRDITLATGLSYNTDYAFFFRTGFNSNSSGTITEHYVDLTFNGVSYNWEVPSPTKSLQAKLRYGCYRVPTGTSVIKFTGVTYERRNNS